MSANVNIEREAREEISEREGDENRPPANLDAVREAIFQRGILLDLDFRMWTASAALKPSDLGLDKVPDGIRLGRIQLLDKELVGKPTSVQGVTRRSVDALSYPFPLSRGRYVPYSRYEALERLLKQQKEKFTDAVEKILAGYDERREEAIEGWVTKITNHCTEHGLTVNTGDLRDRLTRAFPNAQSIRRKYVFEWTPYRIEAPRDVKIAAFNEEARRRLDSSMRGWVEETMLVLRGRITEIANKLRETLAAKGQGAPQGLSEKSRNAILRQIEVIQTLNCFNDTQAEVMLNRLRGEIENDFQTDDGLTTLINEVASFAESDIDEGLRQVMDGLIGAGDRIVEV